jgi:hypothetical protein
VTTNKHHQVISRRPASFTGLAYAERWAYAERCRIMVDLVVPVDERYLIAPGSGIVVAPRWLDDEHADASLPTTGGAVLLYYEGWVYGTPDGITAADAWAEAVRVAANRAVCMYPTTASVFSEAAGFTVVGRLHIADDHVEVSDTAALERWRNAS